MNHRRRPEQIIDGIVHYRCTACGEWKPAEAFHPLGRCHPKSRCGRTPECKTCGNARRRRDKAKAAARKRETVSV